MKYILAGILVLVILAAGCTGSAPSSKVTTATTTQAHVVIDSSTSPEHFQGTGDDVQSFKAVGSGIRIFSMTYTGERNFAVILQNSEGKTVELLANEIGSYTGKSSEALVPGSYYLKVVASGPWTVDISSP